ncbi:hypothetical protein [Rubellimicrobium arenae]|uniref:hypothetical protein n=1 Tax=Rubellimicrobium arenae TaxID=2817372 RepID=UPI001B314B77|nr:hypothetical protein [Rubellimicrobium arenae]
MASNAILALGATVEFSRTGTTGWVKVPEAIGIAIPSVEKSWIDVTNLDSQGYHEYVPGLKDAGERAVPCNYTSDGYEDLIAEEVWSETNGPLYFRTTLRPAPGQSTGDVFEFRAYPSVSVDDATDPEAKLTMTLSLRATGAPEWTRGAAVAP